jgi:hypothetical protein
MLIVWFIHGGFSRQGLSKSFGQWLKTYVDGNNCNGSEESGVSGGDIGVLCICVICNGNGQGGVTSGDSSPLLYNSILRWCFLGIFWWMLLI